MLVFFDLANDAIAHQAALDAGGYTVAVIDDVVTTRTSLLFSHACLLQVEAKSLTCVSMTIAVGDK